MGWAIRRPSNVFFLCVATLEATRGDSGFPVRRKPGLRVAYWRRLGNGPRPLRGDEVASTVLSPGIQSAVTAAQSACSDKHMQLQVHTGFRQTIQVVSMPTQEQLSNLNLSFSLQDQEPAFPQNVWSAQGTELC